MKIEYTCTRCGHKCFSEYDPQKTSFEFTCTNLKCLHECGTAGNCVRVAEHNRISYFEKHGRPVCDECKHVDARDHPYGPWLCTHPLRRTMNFITGTYVFQKCEIFNKHGYCLMFERASDCEGGEVQDE